MAVLHARTAHCVVLLMLLLSVPMEISCQAPVIFPSGECNHYVEDRIIVSCNLIQEPATFHWILNDTHYDHSQLPDIEIADHHTLLVITVNNVSQDYNNTAIRCEGSYRNNQSFSSAAVTILLQGVLQSVTEISSDVSNYEIVNISWTAPHTIDVPSTDPDIKYCVDIYDMSSAEPTRRYSKCEIYQTYHQCAYYPMLIACAKYQVKVIAVNKLGNSTAASHQVGVKGLDFIGQEVIPTEEFNKTVRVNSSTEVCYSKGEVIADGDKSLLSGENNGSVIEFELLDNKHYQNVTIIIHIFDDVKKSLGRIDTYDVTEIEVKNSTVVLSNFLRDTEAFGVLYLVMYCEEVNGSSIQFNRSHYYAVRRQSAEKGFPLNLSNGFYYIWAYDIEYDGNLQLFGLPAAESSVNIIEGSGGNNLRKDNQNCLIKAIEKEITVNCTCTGTIHVLLQRTDADFDIVKNIVTTNTSCGVPAVFNDQQHGSYGTTVFINTNNDALEMEVYFVGEIEFMFSAGYQTTEKVINNDAKIYSVVSVVGIILIFVLAVTTLIMILHSKDKSLLMMGNDFSLCERLQFICCCKRKKWYDTQEGFQSNSLCEPRSLMQSGNNSHEATPPACNHRSSNINEKEKGAENIPDTVPTAGSDELFDGIKKEQNETVNNPETMPPACTDELSAETNKEENETMNNSETALTTAAGSDGFSGEIKEEQNEAMNNSETALTTAAGSDGFSGEIKEEENETMNYSETVLTAAAGSDEFSGEIKEEKNEPVNNPGTVPTACSDELSGVKVKTNETMGKKYADVTFLPSPNSLPVMKVHRVEYTTVRTPGSCQNTNISIEPKMPEQNNELPSQERDDIVPIHYGSVERENLNLQTVEPSSYITPGFIRSFKNNFEMEMLSSDLTFADNDYTEDSCEEEKIEPVVPSENLTFANCDCIDDCCDEENIEPVLPSELSVYDVPGFIPRDFSDGHNSLTKFTTENIVYCIKLECGESTHSLDETIMMKYCQVSEKLANYIVLTIKKTKDYDYLGKFLNIPVLQRAKGCPAYATPEAFHPHLQSPKTDIYSIGACFLEMLTGRLPAPDSRPDIPIQEAITEDLSPFKKVPKDEVAVLIKPFKNEKWTQSLHIQLVRAFYSRRFYERLG